MKNILVCFVCLILNSCSFNYDTSYYFENKTIDTIDIEFHNKKNDIITIKVSPNSNYLFLRVAGILSGPSKMSLNYNDSIFIFKNDKTIKYYRDNDLENQIYNMDNWPLTKAINNVYEYTYTFNEADFN